MKQHDITYFSVIRLMTSPSSSSLSMNTMISPILLLMMFLFRTPLTITNRQFGENCTCKDRQSMHLCPCANMPILPNPRIHPSVNPPPICRPPWWLRSTRICGTNPRPAAAPPPRRPSTPADGRPAAQVSQKHSSEECSAMD